MKDKAYIAPNATVTGDVTLGEKVNVWYGAVLRGDNGPITVGEGTNIQDNAVIHDETVLGRFCTVGHGSIVHGCRVGDSCTIGMGAVVLNGAVLGDNCMVGAGAVVTGKTCAPAGTLLLGNPARAVRTLTQAEIAAQHQNAEHYIQLAREAF